MPAKILDFFFKKNCFVFLIRMYNYSICSICWEQYLLSAICYAKLWSQLSHLISLGKNWFISCHPFNQNGLWKNFLYYELLLGVTLGRRLNRIQYSEVKGRFLLLPPFIPLPLGSGISVHCLSVEIDSLKQIFFCPFRLYPNPFTV